jgi:calcium-dependent protein kinase
VVGGSARKKFVETENRLKSCFGIPLSIFCPLRHEEEASKDVLLMDTIDEQSETESQTHTSASSIITYEHKDATYALKSIHLDRVKDSIFRQELMNEVAILQGLDHPHIVKAIETFDYHNRLYLVLELCSGGDLYARDPYDEVQACSIVHSIVDAVGYMHSQKIIHRDLKFENIMFAHPTSASVKIIDFGLSKKYAQEEKLHDAVGTVYTMAPEVLLGDYDNKVDIWSIGVISFMLLSSSLPFYGKTRPHVIRKIIKGRFTFKGVRWHSISQKAKDFVSSLLVHDASQRPSAQQALKSSWLSRSFDATAPVSFKLMDRVQATIQTFAAYGRLKKLALLVIAHKSTEEEIGFLRKVFRTFDSVADGEITLEEFKGALTVYHYTDEELERMFMAMDLDGTGKVHYTEFLAATIEAHGSIAEERVAEAFDRLDSDDSGYITVQNVVDFLGNEISEEFADGIIDEADMTRDHRISYQEFLSLWDESYYTTFKNALKDVNYRRETFDEGSTDGRSSASSGSDGMDVSTISANSSDLGGGGYFFDVEKERSIRGVWV